MCAWIAGKPDWLASLVPSGACVQRFTHEPRGPQGAEQDGLLPFQVVVPVLPDGGIDPGLDHHVEGQVVRGVWGAELAAETLGEHVFDYFMRNKRAEFEAYRRQVTPWEIARHIRVL